MSDPQAYVAKVVDEGVAASPDVDAKPKERMFLIQACRERIARTQLECDCLPRRLRHADGQGRRTLALDPRRGICGEPLKQSIPCDLRVKAGADVDHRQCDLAERIPLGGVHRKTIGSS